jgi:hypothetical protein
MLDCWGSSPIGDGCSNLPLFRVDHRVSSSPWACTLSEQAKEDDVHPTATTFLSPSFSKKHPRIFSTKLPQACKQVMSPFPPFSSSQLEISSRAVESPAANELTGIRVDTEDVEAGVSEGTREVTLAALRNERMSKVRPGYTERRRDDEQPTS